MSSGLPLLSLALLTGFLLVGGLVWASRRLLGRPVGTVRTCVGALLAFSLSSVLAEQMRRESPGLYLALTVACAVLLTMTFIVIAEALVPTGSLPHPSEIVRSAVRRVSRSRRYYQITRIAVRHGLGPALRGRRGRTPHARSLRLALQEAGVTFVKFGQVLSTRRDLLSPAFLDELSHLQDKVEPASSTEIERVLTEELGGSPHAVFAEFDRTPLAAASIGQVHRARLHSGAEVVVKVQRPGIRPLVERDLDIVERLAATLQQRTRWGRAFGAVELARGFSAALLEELDFRVEARNMTTVAAAQPALRVPALHEELTTERVLVQEWLDGVPLSKAEPIIAEHGLDRARLARDLLTGLLIQIMRDGTFHADPHPGNILLLRDGTLALLDFGSVGRLDGQLRASLEHLLVAVGRNDPAAMSDALLEIVTHPEQLDRPSLERALGQFTARHLNAGPAPAMDMFTDLFRLVAAYDLAVHPEIAAVFRALATLEGTLTRLDPSFDLFAEAQEHASGQFTERLHPSSLQEALADETLNLLPVLRRLPRRLDRITHSLERGRLSVNVRLFADDRDRHLVTTLLHQTLLTVLGATAAVVAALLLGTAGGPQVTPSVSLFQLMGYALFGIGSVLILRVLFTIFRHP
ncbi:AarF/UbiB family protein [Actinomadura kijaniata]|uniref:Ubiquinone biosynthesis protein n=1 Tax=Actinomadura namibiensis TaxID=182080 RepID=A0A7W3LXR8_ACTNM|nr:AarF/UbiB family protein [Actinomadura namibiensis]MBA8956167.1 ubiquinone biosynthesis protein [Actinomadura namibiensis]